MGTPLTGACTVASVPPEEMPILVIGDVTHPHDHVTVSTYRWQHEEETVHGPDAAIFVSSGVLASGAFFHQGSHHGRVLASDFVHFHRGLSGQLEGRSGTANISGAGDAFSLDVTSGTTKSTVTGTILDARSGRVEAFDIRGFTRSHLAVAVHSLERVLEWFDLR